MLLLIIGELQNTSFQWMGWFVSKFVEYFESMKSKGSADVALFELHLNNIENKIDGHMICIHTSIYNHCWEIQKVCSPLTLTVRYVSFHFYRSAPSIVHRRKCWFRIFLNLLLSFNYLNILWLFEICCKSRFLWQNS